MSDHVDFIIGEQVAVGENSINQGRELIKLLREFAGDSMEVMDIGFPEINEVQDDGNQTCSYRKNQFFVIKS